MRTRMCKAVNTVPGIQWACGKQWLVLYPLSWHLSILSCMYHVCLLWPHFEPLGGSHCALANSTPRWPSIRNSPELIPVNNSHMLWQFSRMECSHWSRGSAPVCLLCSDMLAPAVAPIQWAAPWALSRRHLPLLCLPNAQQSSAQCRLHNELFWVTFLFVFIESTTRIGKCIFMSYLKITFK